MTMPQSHETTRSCIMARLIGEHAPLMHTLDIDQSLLDDAGASVSRAQLAMALNVRLFADLLDRVPTAARLVAQSQETNATIVFDHGALRTIAGPTGSLPSGESAFARLLEPLGYEMAAVYPLPRLTMTGRAYVHQDLPEAIPQFFVSELHVDQLAPEAQAATERVFGASRDPIGSEASAALDQLARDGTLPFAQAAALLETLLGAFGRQHAEPALSDYEILLAHSKEAAWIATEGNAFNHATTRVPDVEALAEQLKSQGYPMKDAVEISANGRVRQTAILADKVTRSFRMADGSTADRDVPGSFYEFISRDIDPASGTMDLTFDSGNATGIFAVTRSA
jgi:hypothetical protein